MVIKNKNANYGTCKPQKGVILNNNGHNYA